MVYISKSSILDPIIPFEIIFSTPCPSRICINLIEDSSQEGARARVSWLKSNREGRGYARRMNCNIHSRGKRIYSRVSRYSRTRTTFYKFNGEKLDSGEVEANFFNVFPNFFPPLSVLLNSSSSFSSFFFPFFFLFSRLLLPSVSFVLPLSRLRPQLLCPCSKKKCGKFR